MPQSKTEFHQDGVTLIDVSHVVTDGMITYKGLPAPIICDYLRPGGIEGKLRRGHQLSNWHHHHVVQYRHLC